MDWASSMCAKFSNLLKEWTSYLPIPEILPLKSLYSWVDEAKVVNILQQSGNNISRTIRREREKFLSKPSFIGYNRNNYVSLNYSVSIKKIYTFETAAE